MPISGFRAAIFSSCAKSISQLTRYGFNRLTRLFKVIFPALVLMLIFDSIGLQIDATAYPAPYYEAISPLTTFVRGLTFSTEWFGALDRVRLGTNGPLWSLSYEAGYYILFGIAVFLQGPLRIALIACVAFVVGLPILALMPAWLMGVYLWHRLRDPGLTNLPNSVAWGLAIGAPALLVACKAIGVDDALSAITAAAFGSVSHHTILGYSDEVLWSMLIAVSFAFHLFGAARFVA